MEKIKNIKKLRPLFDELYETWNRQKYLHPDPLEFVYHYDNLRDREVFGLMIACFSYGQVLVILKTAQELKTKMGDSPYDFVLSATAKKLESTFRGFYHRWHQAPDLIGLILSLKKILKKHVSIEQALIHLGDGDLIERLSNFADVLYQGGNFKRNLFPHPAKKSALKRQCMYLRWMVRRDDIDPGGWQLFKPSDLIVPLDTHINYFFDQIGLVHVKQANLKKAVMITDILKSIHPEDPIKYDFALSRMGIHPKGDFQDFINQVQKLV